MSTPPNSSENSKLNVPRPSVMSLAIREKAALYAAYMPFLKNGGIFIPTNREYQIGDDVYLLLTILDDPDRLALAGKVVWITPANAHNGKTQGIGVHFPNDDVADAAKRRIESALGQALKSSRQTHTL